MLRGIDLHEILRLLQLNRLGAQWPYLGRKHGTSRGPGYGARLARGSSLGRVGGPLCLGGLMTVHLAIPVALMRIPGHPWPWCVDVAGRLPCRRPQLSSRGGDNPPTPRTVG